MKRIITVGLTGQSGAGKTTVSEVFKNHGFSVINCDTAAREAVLPETECTKELEEKFPQLFTGGKLDRKKAASLLFSDRALLDSYNSVIFPHIITLINSKIKIEEENGARYILLDAPTLFEAGIDKKCDCVVSCIADRSIRINRIMNRDSLTYELAEKRLASQKSEKFFIENSDYIIENSGEINKAISSAEAVINKIKGIYNGNKTQY